MKAAQLFLSEVKSIVISALTYLHRNAWTIIFILGGAYICYDNCEYLVYLISSPPVGFIFTELYDAACIFIVLGALYIS